MKFLDDFRGGIGYRVVRGLDQRDDKLRVRFGEFFCDTGALLPSAADLH